MDKLTDFQIYSFVVNRDLDKHLKEEALKEFDKRNFYQEYIDQLAIEYEKIIPAISANFTKMEKARIIAFPFFIPIQAIIANKYIAHGNTKKWKLYWKYLTIGWLIWSIVIILMLKIFLRY